MKNSKITRLLLGLIILFSFFIFQGSDDSGDSCTGCDENGSLGGTLTVVNKTDGPWLSVSVQPLISTGTILTKNDSKVFYLDEGVYQVITTQALIVKHIRMITIEIGSDVTLTFK